MDRRRRRGDARQSWSQHRCSREPAGEVRGVPATVRGRRWKSSPSHCRDQVGVRRTSCKGMSSRHALLLFIDYFTSSSTSSTCSAGFTFS